MDEWIRSRFSIKSSKHDLIKTRTRSRLIELGLGTYGEYREYLSAQPKDSDEWQIFVNLMTTNKTDFFREPKHFEFLLGKVLPEWLKTNKQTMKIWSAASSTGEEAYTLAMLLKRYLPAGRDFRILASDIDTDVIRVGQNAVYPVERKVEIPTEYHRDCLDFGRGEVSGWFRMKPDLRERVVFKRHNLIEMSSPGAEVFDLVLCRNVFIYFAPKSVEMVARKLYHSTKRGGYLFIGHSESLQGITHEWDLIAPSTLRKGSRK